MSTLKEMQKLCEQSKFTEALQLAHDAFGDPAFRKSSKDTLALTALAAECHYELGDYKEARKNAQFAMDMGSAEAIDLLAKIVAYVDKDDDKIFDLSEKFAEKAGNEFSESPGVMNAMAIRARDQGSKIDYESVLGFAEEAFTGVFPEWNAKVDDTVRANILHNAGRFLLEKHSDSEENRARALGFFIAATALYGRDKNYHHRAEVLHWLSKAIAKFFDKEAAIGFAQESRQLWGKACTNDTHNKLFAKKNRKVALWLTELQRPVEQPLAPR